MRIGIVGSGHLGAALTARLTALGHDVTVANTRGPESLAELTSRTGARAGALDELVRSADLVVLAVPLKAVPTLAPDSFAGHVLVDTTNYYPPRDGDIAGLAEPHDTSSQWVADHFRDARVVKAFNTISALHLDEHAAPVGAVARRALPVAGDDRAAVRRVLDLVDELGFDPVDAGTLSQSWRQQPGTPVYDQPLDAAQVRDALHRA
jgi:8-hydroxy-5-deazaflavin:NADPH oxidoreductase